MLYTSVLFADVYGNALCSCIETVCVYVCVSVCTCGMGSASSGTDKQGGISPYSNNRLHLPC